MPYCFFLSQKNTLLKTVNASACEFLELLVQHIEDPLVSLRLAQYIMCPLQIVLYHAVDKGDAVMQVH